MADAELDRDVMDAFAGLPEDFNRFARIYQTEIRPALQARETERIKAADTATKSWIAGVIVAAIGAGAAMLIWGAMQLVVLAVVIGLAIGAIGSMPLQRLSGQAKTMLVVPIAESLGFQFNGKPGRVDSLSQHRRLGLVPSYDRSRFEDLLTGRRNGVDFEFFEAKLKERRQSSSRSGTRTRYVTVFDGQLLRFDFHRRFFGETLVTRDAGWFNAFGGRRGMDRARLEDPVFEKAFEVYTTDQVEARFLLTPDMMQALNDLERTFRGKDLRCAFSGQEMFIAVEGTDLFEPGSLFKPLDNPVRVRELLDDFAAVFLLIDTVSRGREAEEDARGAAPDGREAEQGGIGQG